MKTPEVYAEPLSDDGTLMPREEFLDAVKDGSFIDYDGFGHPVKNNLMSNRVVHPSQVRELPSDATHVLWYNR